MKKLFKYLGFTFLALFLSAICFFTYFKVQSAYALPNDFVKTKVAEGFNLPTEFTFAPDGRIFVVEQNGAIKIVKGGSTLTQPFMTLPVDSDGERGAIGLAFDPNFSSNNFIYISYVNKNPLEMRLSRFTANGDTVASGSEVVLLRSEQQLGLIHHSGTIRIGPDGKLWMTIGNNNSASNPQDLSNIHGKILRINLDGSIPQDNPFVNQPGAKGEIWAYGLRNPFRFNFLPDGRPIVGDVGDASWEEVNVIVKGGNYGYPVCEGTCSNSFINPVYQYSHEGAGASVTGGFVYNGDQFPAQYKNSYFFGDYTKRFIKRLVLDSAMNVVSVEDFDTSAGSVVELKQGPDGTLYFIQFYGNGFPSPGTLWKISYNTGNKAPTAVISSNKKEGALPLEVNFSSQGSTDPENAPLKYSWNFGDGQTSTEANPTHTYTSKGIYTATLTVSDGQLNSEPVNLSIAAGQSFPSVTITSPTESTKYNQDQTISFSATASDAEDGELQASAFRWLIVFHHNTHIHPHGQVITGVKSGSFVADINEPDTDTYYEIRLAVKDSSGLETIVSRNIHPNLTTLTLNTNPSGLGVTLDGKPVTTPYSTSAVVGMKRFISTQTLQTKDNENYQFQSWSDNGEPSHQITIPAQNANFTANFKSVGSGMGSIRLRISKFGPNTEWLGTFVNGATVKLTDVTGNTVYRTATSGVQNGEDGWVFFDNIPVGTYGLMAYQEGYLGVWKQADCFTQNGTFDNASIQNSQTGLYVAAWDNNVPVTANNVTVCQDLGLKVANTGNLFFRIMQIKKSTTSPSGYGIEGYINDATVKLTDQTGNTVVKETKSIKTSDNQDGWVFFNDIPVGNYGVMAYKAGFDGFLKQVNCNGQQVIDSTINNQNTEGKIAAWNNNVTIVGGTITFCTDLGFVPSGGGTGNLRFRIPEFDSKNNPTGNFLNGATVKLTDQSGNNVIKTGVSGNKSGQDGWVWFDDIPAGTYGILAYKEGFEGVWKQVDCNTAGGSFQNATIKNANTDGKVAAFDDTAQVQASTVTVCQDLGLKTISSPKGNLRFRISEFNENNGWSGKFMNGATVKLTDQNGNTVVKTATSGVKDGQDGWVWFDDVEVGTYGIMAYKEGFEGVWKQVDCVTNGGSFQNATINNGNTESKVAAWDNSAPIQSNQTTVCQDLGLKPKQVAKGRLAFRIAEYDNRDFTKNYIDGATVKLTDTSGNNVIATQTSFTIQNVSYPGVEDQKGWVIFNDVPVGNYGVMAYKNEYTGIWKQVDCSNNGQGTFDNATIQNANTEGKLAAFDNFVEIKAGQTTVCQDLGLDDSKNRDWGNIRFRVREFDQNGVWTGKYLNDIYVELTGTKVINKNNDFIRFTKVSSSKSNEDGWVWFDYMQPDNYRFNWYFSPLPYYQSINGDRYTLVWHQDNCSEPGNISHNDSNIQSATLQGGEVVVCKDIGLKKVSGNISLLESARISTSSASVLENVKESSSAALIEKSPKPSQSPEVTIPMSTPSPSPTPTPSSSPSSSPLPSPSPSVSPKEEEKISTDSAKQSN